MGLPGEPYFLVCLFFLKCVGFEQVSQTVAFQNCHVLIKFASHATEEAKKLNQTLEDGDEEQSFHS